MSVFFLCLLVESAYSALTPMSFKYLIDDAFYPKDIRMFGFILIVLLIGGLLALGAGLFGEHLMALVNEKAIFQLRKRLFDKMLHMPIPFYQAYDHGTLMSRLTADVLTVDRVMTGVVPSVFKGLFGLMVGLFLLFQLEWKLASMMVVGFALLFFSPKLMTKKAEQSTIAFRKEQDAYMGTVDELLRGHRVIKGLNLQNSMAESVKIRLQGMFDKGFRLTYHYALLDRIPIMAFMLLNVGVIITGGFLIFRDDLQVGEFIAFYTIFLNVGNAVSSLSQLFPALMEAEVSFRRLDDILDYTGPDEDHAQKRIPLTTLKQDIRFDHVTFSYNSDVKALDDVSFHIPAGKLTAFVGPSGSGKSTALQLLIRFYHPQKGAVRIGETDLRHIDEAQFRQQTGIVFQDSFLFNTTIADNIRMPNPDASDSQVREAAKSAQIHDFIMALPEQYATQIQDYGANLSGGQRQRMAIARAFMRNPELLVLDEVTSALDPSTEAEINTLIEGFRGAGTIVTVTHRLASVKNADQIIVFHKGRVAEVGTHDSLIAQGGIYQEMWDKQQGFHLTADGFHAKVTGERLAKLSFFQGIPSEQLDSISELFVAEKYEAAQTVIRQHDPGDKFYIIVRGQVSVVIDETRVAVLEDGDHFGEIALLRNVPRTADVITQTPTLLLSLRSDQLHGLSQQFPVIRRVLEQSLKDRFSGK
ncbi:ABC transporter transmembrane domain-containing protein [Xylanibacillus composti]|nr:ABC transporter transmembrane domain-containing protein [Xylanibacillus composti]